MFILPPFHAQLQFALFKHAMKLTVWRTGTITMREIDLFENRLQLKTLQEGLKHKVASVDITPNLVHGVFLPERRRTASERRWQAFAEQHQSDGRQQLLKSM